MTVVGVPEDVMGETVGAVEADPTPPPAWTTQERDPRYGDMETHVMMTAAGADTGDATRDALMDAARELFGRKGYSGARITDIASAAGMSVSTFYARLGSKEEAYRAVMGTAPPGKQAPELSARAQRSRKALVRAARACIERDGYSAARITDIAAEAGVAVGTFYTHFASKLDVFTEVVHGGLLVELDRTQARVLHEPSTAGALEGSAAAEARAQARRRVRSAVERFISGYSRHALLMLRVDEAIGVHPELVPLRLKLHRGYAEQIAASLRHWQECGIIHSDLDTGHAADALAAMVGHTTRVWVTYGQTHDQETAISTLTRLWAEGIGLGASEQQAALPIEP
ncbi:MAG: TetR/AcrR family transcriptional regulator [Streptomyces sp.]